MPRNRQAFSRLKDAINQTGFTALPGTPAGNYLDFLQNKREKGTPKVARVTAKARGRLQLGLVPFSAVGAIDPATTRKESGYITVHSAKCVAPGLVPTTGFTEATVDTGLFGGLAWTKTDLGVYVPDATTNENAGFYSAAINIKAVDTSATTSTQVTSGITGRKYSYKNSGSATVPFGKVVATDNITTRFNILLAEARDANIKGTISLLPEKAVGGRNVAVIA